MVLLDERFPYPSFHRLSRWRFVRSKMESIHIQKENPLSPAWIGKQAYYKLPHTHTHTYKLHTHTDTHTHPVLVAHHEYGPLCRIGDWKRLTTNHSMLQIMLPLKLFQLLFFFFIEKMKLKMRVWGCIFPFLDRRTVLIVSFCI